MCINLTLAAEDFADCYGIMIIEDESFVIEIDHSKIPSELLKKLQDWYAEYYPFTGMSSAQLDLQLNKVNYLDQLGIELLKQIFDEKIFDNVDNYKYFSRGRDKILIEMKNCLKGAFYSIEPNQ